MDSVIRLVPFQDLCQTLVDGQWLALRANSQIAERENLQILGFRPRELCNELVKPTCFVGLNIGARVKSNEGGNLRGIPGPFRKPCAV